MRNTTFKCLILGIASLAIASCSKKTQPEEYLNEQAVKDFKYSIARYICHLPKFATEESKFLTQFDAAYQENSTKIKLDKYYQAPDNDTIYFEVSKLAPSIKRKYNATGGRLVKDDQNKIIFYEEIYRTWKMEDSLLKARTVMFFNDMIAHKDLSTYYTENINSDTYIEFPNKNCIFDIATRKWVLQQDLAYVH